MKKLLKVRGTISEIFRNKPLRPSPPPPPPLDSLNLIFQKGRSLVDVILAIDNGKS